MSRLYVQFYLSTIYIFNILYIQIAEKGIILC